MFNQWHAYIVIEIYVNKIYAYLPSFDAYWKYPVNWWGDALKIHGAYSCEAVNETAENPPPKFS